jgi:hypothetical protein
VGLIIKGTKGADGLPIAGQEGDPGIPHHAKLPYTWIVLEAWVNPGVIDE